MENRTKPQFTLYTSTASQWAYVAHLTLDEKGYEPRDYTIEQVDLVHGENFAPEYVKINPNGTIPSLTSTSLPEALIESADILKYLDSNHPMGSTLFPANSEQLSKVEELIAHVHQPRLSTNLILLQARDEQELDAKTAGPWKGFIDDRQEKLVKYGALHPEIPLYVSRTQGNGRMYDIYNAHEIGPEHQQFFDESLQGYRDFAAGLDDLDRKLVLPYAAGDRVTAADMHIVPWLAHALWGAGGKGIDEFEPLESLIKRSVPDFEFGEKTKTWWRNISETSAFKKNYPSLH
ncbi:hypothetical protein V496_02937 [Pseudogymnoascus sp. VKM F-4515 (FW-2607)]|nr:hypothetical protein V496_02937 [Pseudogymnoascus sp. VKM F-4515 (FW-2607)]KFY95840.1 hypothetical protein V498_03095 [Pseudogymnoascus sp. VKM F-4517 (FW-2822)]